MIEVTSRGVLETTRLQGSFDEFVSNLNIAAASGKQFVLATEARRDAEDDRVALNTQLIAVARPVEVEDAFVGR
jgi:hypothetical protein